MRGRAEYCVEWYFCLCAFRAPRYAPSVGPYFSDPQVVVRTSALLNSRVSAPSVARGKSATPWAGGQARFSRARLASPGSRARRRVCLQASVAAARCAHWHPFAIRDWFSNAVFFVFGFACGSPFHIC
eukprot:12333583-Alexandrium_andersonii.AAC.1